MHRRTLNWMGDRHKDKDIEVNLDGIGGVNILVKADVHRYGRQPNLYLGFLASCCSPTCRDPYGWELKCFLL